jgi:hypothetical protein
MQFVENELFQRFVTDMVFALTSDTPVAPWHSCSEFAVIRLV